MDGGRAPGRRRRSRDGFRRGRGALASASVPTSPRFLTPGRSSRWLLWNGRLAGVAAEAAIAWSWRRLCRTGRRSGRSDGSGVRGRSSRGGSTEDSQWVLTGTAGPGDLRSGRGRRRAGGDDRGVQTVHARLALFARARTCRPRQGIRSRRWTSPAASVGSTSTATPATLIGDAERVSKPWRTGRQSRHPRRCSVQRRGCST